MFQNRDASYAITCVIQYLLIDCTLASIVKKIDPFLIADGTLAPTHSNEHRVSSRDSGCSLKLMFFNSEQEYL